MLIFKKEIDTSNEYDLSEITFGTNAVSLDEVLDEFSLFLRACGYILPKGDHPIIVNDEEME